MLIPTPSLHSVCNCASLLGVIAVQPGIISHHYKSAKYALHVTNGPKTYSLSNPPPPPPQKRGWGSGFDLLPRLAFLPSVISSFFTQN